MPSSGSVSADETRQPVGVYSSYTAPRTLPSPSATMVKSTTSLSLISPRSGITSPKRWTGRSFFEPMPTKRRPKLSMRLVTGSVTLSQKVATGPKLFAVGTTHATTSSSRPIQVPMCSTSSERNSGRAMRWRRHSLSERTNCRRTTSRMAMKRKRIRLNDGLPGR